MKAMRLEDGWGLDHVRCIDLPDPEPGPDEVLVRIEAVSINPRDRILMMGGYGRMGGEPPLVPLCDGAGRVVAVGERVEDFEVGDFVVPHYSRTWPAGPLTAESHRGAHGGPCDGTMRELMPVPAAALAHAPAHMSAEEAATLPCAALTAWSAVVEQGAVKAGQSVLLQGTGGVSLFALLFAKMQGARVIHTSSSDEKLERVRAMGADHGINYRSDPDWHRTAREIAGGPGLDLIVDVGGGDTLGKSIAAVRPSGTVCLIGVLGGSAPALELGKVVTRNIRLQGVTVGACDAFKRMIAALQLHGTRAPLDDSRFAFEDLPRALAALPEQKHFGKVVCRF